MADAIGGPPVAAPYLGIRIPAYLAGGGRENSAANRRELHRTARGKNGTEAACPEHPQGAAARSQASATAAPGRRTSQTGKDGKTDA